MFLGLIFYGCIGLGLAIASLAIPKLRRTIDLMAERYGMGGGYAYAIWLVSTIVAWPIGLYVLTTGRLLLVHSQTKDLPGGTPSTVIGSADS